MPEISENAFKRVPGAKKRKWGIAARNRRSGLSPNPPETLVPLTVSNLAGARMSKNQPLPVDPLHQQPDAPGVDQDDAQIEKPKEDAFKKPPSDKGLGKAVKKG
jgi:hypothetical protein